MSDLAATSCCNNDCGCQTSNNNDWNCSSWIWIILLLSCCGGCGNTGCGNRTELNNIFGGNDCNSIIILILLLSCCGCGSNN